MERSTMSQPDPVDLQPRELLQIAADFFEARGIAYRVVGSMASIAYGENRFTNDVDIVADLRPEHVDDLCAFFPAPDYYVARHAVEDAIRRGFQFNIIHIPAGLKIDVMLPKRTEYGVMEQQRAKRLTDPDGLSAVFAAPEDVILNKLLFFQLGGSEKHLRDIAGILKVKADAVDRRYITEWAAKLGVAEEWGLLQKSVDEASP
jgi:hypothetical protein